MSENELSKGAGGRFRVLIADDHPVVRTGLAAIIAQEPDLELVAEAENGQRALALFREHQPDVVLMDLRMPLMDGVEAIRRITAEFPAARILALTTSRETRTSGARSGPAHGATCSRICSSAM
jgi:DNA-binding NarL/FixJ family response regulator